MVQSYKNVYFPDYQQAAPGRSSFTLAFGKHDRDIFDAVAHLSSDALRNALGYQSFSALQRDARQQRRTVNAFCLSILRRHLDADKHYRDQGSLGLRRGNPIALDPIQATFSGGRHEPLHDWYPYLVFVYRVPGEFA